MAGESADTSCSLGVIKIQQLITSQVSADAHELGISYHDPVTLPAMQRGKLHSWSLPSHSAAWPRPVPRLNRSFQSVKLGPETELLITKYSCSRAHPSCQSKPSHTVQESEWKKKRQRHRSQTETLWCWGTTRLCRREQGSLLNFEMTVSIFQWNQFTDCSRSKNFFKVSINRHVFPTDSVLTGPKSIF